MQRPIAHATATAARDVVERVDATKPLNSKCDHFFSRCRVRRIRSHPDGLIAQQGERLIDIRLRATKDRDLRTLLDQPLRR